MGKQCIVEKQNNSESGIGEMVVNLRTVTTHDYIQAYLLIGLNTFGI